MAGDISTKTVRDSFVERRLERDLRVMDKMIRDAETTRERVNAPRGSQGLVRKKQLPMADLERAAKFLP